ncbi:MAG: oligopeptide transporter, OPT family [Planctomycetes bacterium]|nr:oligopeptide transporter, OPT family [Planctomycetota bacterium]
MTGGETTASCGKDVPPFRAATMEAAAPCDRGTAWLFAAANTPPTTIMREFSPRAMILGVAIGALLAAPAAYVGLKVGMTVSASIPAAVLSMLVMRASGRRGTLLEHNMVQTIGSAGQSLAAGMIFTIPALFILGAEPKFLEMVVWGGVGGLLGVCFMVPLRRVLIVREQAVLPYPEGVACAKVLESAEAGGSGALAVVRGAVVGAGMRLLTGLGFWPESAVTPVPASVKVQGALSVEPALVGVGCILGARVAVVMLAGAALANGVLIPTIGFFGRDVAIPVPPAPGLLVGDMAPRQLHEHYIKYIGAGAVAVAGLVALLRSVPTLLASLWHIGGGLRAPRHEAGPRDRDLPLPLLLLLVAGLGYAMWRFPQVRVDHLGAIAILVFGFFFVTVSSRLVGLVGASSNPASGMTIAALLGTCLAFKLLAGDGGDPLGQKVACLSVGAIVCCAICIAGDISQDLKTGYLVRATPWKQQVGEMLGVLTCVVVNAAVILLLIRNVGVVASAEHPNPFPAPQANIMRMLVDGVLGGTLPWELITIGAALAVILEMLQVRALPFAVGFYLPLSLTTPIMVGGVVRLLVDRRRRWAAEHEPGVLAASGLVAGNGLMGIALVGISALITWYVGAEARWLNPLSGIQEPVAPGHLVPWLWQTVWPAAIRWGLSSAWWDALPAAPLTLISLWLWLQARKPAALILPRVGVEPSALASTALDAEAPANEIDESAAAESPVGNPSASEAQPWAPLGRSDELAPAPGVPPMPVTAPGVKENTSEAVERRNSEGELICDDLSEEQERALALRRLRPPAAQEPPTE